MAPGAPAGAVAGGRLRTPDFGPAAVEWPFGAGEGLDTTAAPSARRRLGEALGARVCEVADRAVARLARLPWQGPPPSAEYMETRHLTMVAANMLIARWLITGEETSESESEWLSHRGRATAAEHLAIVNVTRSYLAWRDAVIDCLTEDAQHLGTPPPVLEAALAGVRRSSDSAVVRMARAYDAEMDRVMTMIEAERNAYREQSLRDPLTGLPNRVVLFDRLQTAVSAAHRDGALVAVLLVDLNLFKEVNDNHGHAIGDEVLVRVGRRLAAQLRASDTVARLGGDEFVVVIPRCRSRAAAREVADKIEKAVARPIQSTGGRVRVGCSVGLALHPDDGDEPEALLRAADRTMYRDKRLSRASVR